MPSSTCVPGASLASPLPCSTASPDRLLSWPNLKRTQTETLFSGRHQKVADKSVMGLRDILGNEHGKRLGRKPKNETDQTITLSALLVSGMRMT